MNEIICIRLYESEENKINVEELFDDFIHQHFIY